MDKFISIGRGVGITATFLIALASSGCASSVPFKGMDEPEYMTRQEIIQATRECEQAGMIPVVAYAQARVQGKRVQVPYDVHCQPNYRRAGS